MVMLMTEITMLVRQSENDGDGTSQGQEGKESHPGSSVGHETPSLVKTLFFTWGRYFPIHSSLPIRPTP